LVWDNVDAGDEDTSRQKPVFDSNTRCPLSRAKSHLRDVANTRTSIGRGTHQADRSLQGQTEAGGDMMTDDRVEKTDGFLEEVQFLVEVLE
jgi:hypothetical protein